jgi:hypothetical protein
MNYVSFAFKINPKSAHGSPLLCLHLVQVPPSPAHSSMAPSSLRLKAQVLPCSPQGPARPACPLAASSSLCPPALATWALHDLPCSLPASLPPSVPPCPPAAATQASSLLLHMPGSAPALEQLSTQQVPHEHQVYQGGQYQGCHKVEGILRWHGMVRAVPGR